MYPIAIGKIIDRVEGHPVGLWFREPSAVYLPKPPRPSRLSTFKERPRAPLCTRRTSEQNQGYQARLLTVRNSRSRTLCVRCLQIISKRVSNGGSLFPTYRRESSLVIFISFANGAKKLFKKNVCHSTSLSPPLYNLTASSLMLLYSDTDSLIS